MYSHTIGSGPNPCLGPRVRICAQTLDGEGSQARAAAFPRRPGSPASLLAGVEQKPHLARAKVLYRRVGPRSSGVSTGATGGASTALVAGRVGCVEAPPESRAAMRRDRSRSAICLGTSTDLIKLIG